MLSENTGAHEELGECALSVNPFDIEEQAEAIHRARRWMPPSAAAAPTTCAGSSTPPTPATGSTTSSPTSPPTAAADVTQRCLAPAGPTAFPRRERDSQRRPVAGRGGTPPPASSSPTAFVANRHRPPRACVSPTPHGLNCAIPAGCPAERPQARAAARTETAPVPGNLELIIESPARRSAWGQPRPPDRPPDDGSSGCHALGRPSSGCPGRLARMRPARPRAGTPSRHPVLIAAIPAAGPHGTPSIRAARPRVRFRVPARFRPSARR